MWGLELLACAALVKLGCFRQTFMHHTLSAVTVLLARALVPAHWVTAIVAKLKQDNAVADACTHNAGTR